MLITIEGIDHLTTAGFAARAGISPNALRVRQHRAKAEGMPFPERHSIAGLSLYAADDVAEYLKTYRDRRCKS